MLTSVCLSDEDLAKLTGSTNTDTRVAAEAAANRLAAPVRWPDVSAHVGALIADVLAEANKERRLLWRVVQISSCRYCGAHSKWKKRRRKDVEIKMSGVEFADRFVVIQGHISVGACMICVEQAEPILRSELARLPVQLPRPLRIDGSPVFQRWERRRCKKCEWTGHEGQLGKLRTLMGDGWYPGKCPSCGIEQKLFENPFESVDGFDVVEVSP